MADWVVIGTSMVIEDEPDGEAAINRAQDMSGWNWEAIPAMNLNPLVHYANVLEAAQEAQDAAYGDSNDSEIELLRDALDMALSALGLELPDGHDPNDEESVRGCSCGMADYGAPGHDGSTEGHGICDRHGGPWGDDETCARCTYEDGTVRPLTDKGELR